MQKDDAPPKFRQVAACNLSELVPKRQVRISQNICTELSTARNAEEWTTSHATSLCEKEPSDSQHKQSQESIVPDILLC